MNAFFVILFLSSLIYLLIYAPNFILSYLITGAQNAINLGISLIAIYSIWLSFIKIMEKAGINKFLYKIFKPMVSLLFKGESPLTLEYITLNFTSNLLGMGGAATPLGIKAIENMNQNNGILTSNMILFMVINATSIQLLPTTIISLRTKLNSLNASDIVIPCLISTSIATICGVLLCYVFRGKQQ